MILKAGPSFSGTFLASAEFLFIRCAGGPKLLVFLDHRLAFGRKLGFVLVDALFFRIPTLGLAAVLIHIVLASGHIMAEGER